MKEFWRVLHFSSPLFNDGCYLAGSFDEAQDVVWALRRHASENGCSAIYIQRVQKLVGNEWLDVSPRRRDQPAE